MAKSDYKIKVGNYARGGMVVKGHERWKPTGLPKPPKKVG